jgi:GntR family transcriptional regulator, carbon starvation induced regulator
MQMVPMNKQNTVEAPEAKTRASAIYSNIRRAILDGSLTPGAKLNVRDLSAQYDSGLSPVRESLNKLAMERLAVHTDNRGFIVSPLSIPELEDLTQARCWMNDIGLRRSIELGDENWEEAVLVSCHRLSRTPRDRDEEGSNTSSPEWDRVHKTFHQTLISACGSPWLIETCSHLFDSAERYRSLARLAGASRSDPRDEHSEIMTATLERDADTAALLLTEHFQRTADLVRATITSDAHKESTI